MSDQQPDITDPSAWQWRWPGLAVGGVEMIDGTLIYTIEGSGVKDQWDEQDAQAAQRAYPDQSVVLTHDRYLILVGPTAEAMAASLKNA